MKQGSESVRLLPSTIWSNPIHVVSTGFGAGMAPKAPGTAGTIVAVLMYLLFAPIPLAYHLVAVAILFILGVWLCNVTARNLGVHDHPAIVWDEIVGFLATVVALPQGWPWVLAAFVLFRLFDIVKPWPIALIDKHVRGGLGIMLDDLLAGLYGFALLQAIHILL